MAIETLLACSNSNLLAMISEGQNVTIALLCVSVWGLGESLGTRAQIPTGYMVKTLRAQSTFDSNVPSD